MSLSKERRINEDLVCDGCNKEFGHSTNYDHHIEYSTSCRLKRAIKRCKRGREAGAPHPQGPPIELRPFVVDLEEAIQDDPLDFAPPEDNPPPGDQPEDDPTNAVGNRHWDSTEQIVSWIKRAKLSQSQTDEMLNLFRDQRMDMREALETVRSHRDVDRYLMSQIVGEVRVPITGPLVAAYMVYCGSDESLALEDGETTRPGSSLLDKVL